LVIQYIEGPECPAIRQGIMHKADRPGLVELPWHVEWVRAYGVQAVLATQLRYRETGLDFLKELKNQAFRGWRFFTL
jgi:hypothetical protein